MRYVINENPEHEHELQSHCYLRNETSGVPSVPV